VRRRVVEQSQRTVRLRSFWSLALLLAALVAYLGSLVTVSTGYGLALFSLAAALVVAGVSVAVGAVVAGSRVVNRSQQTVLVWSLWSLALLLAAVVILVGSYGILATPDCRQECAPSIAYAGFTLLLTPLLGVASVLAGVGAGVAGVFSAATSGKLRWLAAMFAYLIGSVISAVLVYRLVGQHVLSVDSPVVVLFVSPLLTPVVTLIYSLSGRGKSPRT
jgi:hypothetical protein